jgi:hypothetical protein
MDEGSVTLREAMIGSRSILPGKELAFTFGTFRANDLIWRYVVDSYLKGNGSQSVRPAVLGFRQREGCASALVRLKVGCLDQARS